jgi:hypothetical protein
VILQYQVYTHQLSRRAPGATLGTAIPTSNKCLSN